MLEENFGVFLIGLVSSLTIHVHRRSQMTNFISFPQGNPEQPDHLTLVDLQGQSDREFLVGFFGSQKFPRKSLKDRWPGSVDENMERLANAGLPFDRMIAKCRNCESNNSLFPLYYEAINANDILELGHISKSCPEEAREAERVQIVCVNCKEVGHRVRDCTQPRKSKHGCRNCG
jgi:hypothetical protein